MDWWDGITLWDHHCHTLVSPASRANLDSLARALSEAPASYPLVDLQHMAVYWEALYVAAEALGVPLDQVAKALHTRDWGSYCRHLLTEAGYGGLLVDTGYAPRDPWPVEAVETATGIPVLRILRVESVAEQELLAHPPFPVWLERVTARIEAARAEGYVGLKSIVAYRSGLEVAPGEPDRARSAYEAMLQSGVTRLMDRNLLNYLLDRVTAVAVSQDLPLQFHTGFGDPDTDLRRGNPLHLRDYLERWTPRGLRVCLLHTYPFHREAGYLASVYAGVYCDVSLAVPIAASGASRIIGEALELAPVTRFLFASDAHSRPESFALAARLWRRGVGAWLDEATHTHHVPPSLAADWAALMAAGNCRAVYGQPL